MMQLKCPSSFGKAQTDDDNKNNNNMTCETMTIDAMTQPPHPQTSPRSNHCSCGMRMTMNHTRTSTVALSRSARWVHNNHAQKTIVLTSQPCCTEKRRADMTTLTKHIPNARRMYVHTALGFNFMRCSHLRKLLGFKNRVPGK